MPLWSYLTTRRGRTGSTLAHKWLVTWWCQVISLINIDLLYVRSINIQTSVPSQEMSQPPIIQSSFKVTYLKSHSNLSGTSELTLLVLKPGNSKETNQCHAYWYPDNFIIPVNENGSILNEINLDVFTWIYFEIYQHKLRKRGLPFY